MEVNKIFKERLEQLIKEELAYIKTEGLLSPHIAEQIILELGFQDEDNFECNGWDWDFWKKYSKDGVTYTLAGSGWYNNGLTFSKD